MKKVTHDDDMENVNRFSTSQTDKVITKADEADYYD